MHVSGGSSVLWFKVLELCNSKQSVYIDVMTGPGTVLGTLNTLSLLILKVTLWMRYEPDNTAEKIKV